MFLIRCLQTAALNKTKWEWNTEKVVKNDEKRFHAVNQLSGWDLLGSWELAWCSAGRVGVNFAWRDGVYIVWVDFRCAFPLFHFVQHGFSAVASECPQDKCCSSLDDDWFSLFPNVERGWIGKTQQIYEKNCASRLQRRDAYRDRVKCDFFFALKCLCK